MTTERHSLAGKIMAGIGIAVLLSEVGLHIYSYIVQREFELNHVVLAIGVAIGFAGFWAIDPKKTKDGVETIRDVVPKFGRRANDAVAIPDAETTITAVPIDEVKDGKRD